MKLKCPTLGGSLIGDLIMLHVSCPSRLPGRARQRSHHLLNILQDVDAAPLPVGNRLNRSPHSVLVKNIGEFKMLSIFGQRISHGNVRKQEPQYEKKSKSCVLHGTALRLVLDTVLAIASHNYQNGHIAWKTIALNGNSPGCTLFLHLLPTDSHILPVYGTGLSHK